jgi:heme/copper-type cytochrome/quinol oxidase subunit 4
MRQSLSNSVEARPRPPATTRDRRGAARAATAAAVLSAVLPLAALVDQVGMRSLADHAAALDAPSGTRPDPGLLYGLVYSVAVVEVSLWLLATRAVRSRRPSATVLAVAATTITVSLAVLLLVSREYGVQVFPPLWGVLAVLPAAAGSIAAALLLRPRR